MRHHDRRQSRPGQRVQLYRRRITGRCQRRRHLESGSVCHHLPAAGRLSPRPYAVLRTFAAYRPYSRATPASVRQIPRLLARNERLVCHFDTDFGPMVLVMVGALLVSGVEAVWSGKEIPAYGQRIRRKDWQDDNLTLPRGAEMARFNYGSTVIVLLPPGAARLESKLGMGVRVKLGQGLARRVSVC